MKIQIKQLIKNGSRGILDILFFILLTVPASAGLENLPVQDGGRIKPFDTFAREMLSLVYGRETYKGKPAVDIVFSWMLIPDEWEQTEFLLIRHSGLREALKLDKKKLYYKPSDLLVNDRIGLLIQELKNKREAQEKLDPFSQAVQTLENQISAFHGVRLGLALRVHPPLSSESHNWLNITELDGAAKVNFEEITRRYIDLAAAESKIIEATKKKESSKIIDELRKNKKQADLALSETTVNYIKSVESSYGDYSHRGKISAELAYNKYHPFRFAWVLSLCALIFFSFAYFGTKPSWMKIGWLLTGAALVFQMIGFAARVYILERAPVTNMFETVAWVAFTTIIMAAVFYKIYEYKILPLAANMVSTLSLILCDVSSSVLDDSLSPLEPVLRDNFWLLTHVVIIVTSYAAFFLAFFIGDILLFYFLRDEKKYAEKITHGANSIYRCIQVGVVLLAAGVILGGIWADYSWGRFWGWDPKETWAFIALLGYLVILHGRLVGWLRNFGLAASSVVAFSLVIMAWYGVNFVLGAGLHTYGFGAGGVEYVSAFVCAHLLFVAYVTTLRQSRLKGLKT